MIRLASAKIVLGVVLGVFGVGGVAAAVASQTVESGSESWSPSSERYGVTSESGPQGSLTVAAEDEEGSLDEEESLDEVEVDPSDGLSDEELEVLCESAGSHGEYVSQVARDRVTETDGTHGERVSEAAHSDCGKSDDDSGEEELQSEEGEAESSRAASSELDEGDSDGPGQGNSRGQGNGNGKGRGHGRDKDRG